MVIPKMTGQELRAYRLALKMTQKEFGRALGFKNPQIQISTIESGRRPVSGRVIGMIRLLESNRKLLERIKTDAGMRRIRKEATRNLVVYG